MSNHRLTAHRYEPADEPRRQPARVAIVLEKTPGLPTGGSHAVGAWMVEALRRIYDVTIITLDSNLSVDGLNGYFGTAIGHNDVRIERVPLPLPLRWTAKLVLLKRHILLRHCARVAPNYDLVIFSSGEAGIGGRGIQYIHFPSTRGSRGNLVGIYEGLCERISGHSEAGVQANVTLTNSAWTAAAIRRAYNVEPLVLHPPVPEDYREVPWDSREDGFLCIGRITPEKGVDRVIRILKGVRERGFDVHLHVIGEFQDRGYWRKISRLLDPSWVTVEGVLRRGQLVELLSRHKYGLHGMPQEHFGIVVGEMAKAGCIVFVPDGGGQVEIVNDDRLTYHDEADAIDKICAVMHSRSRQMELRDGLARSSGRYSSAIFIDRFRRIVQDFLRPLAQGSQDPIGAASLIEGGR